MGARRRSAPHVADCGILATMKHALDLFSWSGRVSRRAYVLAGVCLFAVKYLVDLAVAHAFRQDWNPLMYLSPRVSPLFRFGEQPRYWLALLAVALPFMYAGLSLTVRRLRDMGVSPFWAGLFFAPFVHFCFFAALAFTPAPAATPPAPVDGGPYREALVPPPRIAAPRFLTRAIPRALGFAYLLGMLLTLVMGLSCYAVAIRVSQQLGVMLFIGLPFAMGFFTAFCCAYDRPLFTRRQAIWYGISPIFISLLALIAVAFEGVACVVMAAPLLVAMAIIGALIGWSSARSAMAPMAPLLLLLLPGLVGVDLVRPLQPAPLSVVSTVIVHASPAVVWKNVISFPPIDSLPEPVFAIVAMPLEARIDDLGRDPGATRRCVFTNGTFVEPIEVWNEPRELTFGVKEQPAHLDEYIGVTRGQFLITPNADGTTTLTGTTWYRLKVFPTVYWKWWSDRLLHAIHLRVLHHVQRLSERPGEASVQAEMPAWMRASNATCDCTRHATREMTNE